MRLKAFWSSSLDAARNFAIEEFLLERAGEGEAFFLAYVNEDCAVIGRNQNPWAELNLPRVPAVFRRLSGGGTVWQDRGNLNWSLMLPRSAHDWDAELAELARAISSLGVVVESGPRGGLFTGPEAALPGAKLSGTARRFAARSVLHHGTLLVNSDLAAMEAALTSRLSALLGPEKAPGGHPSPSILSSRALGSEPARVVNLSALLPGLDVESAAEGLIDALCGTKARPVEGLLPEGALEAARSRHRSWDWVYGETPAFEAQALAVRVEVKRGIVVAARARAEGTPGGWLTGLVGRRFDLGELDRAASFSRSGQDLGRGMVF